MSDKLVINNLGSEYADMVARLHREGIHTGFISSLGQDVVREVYASILECPTAFGFVAMIDHDVVGFVAFAEDLGALYKSVFRKRFLRLGWALLPRIFSFQTMRRITQTLLYPRRKETVELPPAELMAIAVSDQMRGQGLARQLIETGLAECRRRGLAQVKVLVGADNEPANRLYRKCGFTMVLEIESHGHRSNIYVNQL